MGLHPAAAAATSAHRSTTRQRPPDDRGHSLHPHHGLSLAGLAARVWRADDGVATAQALGRRRRLGAHLAAALAALDQQGKLDWSMAFLDGSFAPAKKGGEKVGLTKKGKGTKWMLVVDGNGLPLGFHLDSANKAEVKLAEQTLDTIRVARPRGRPKRRPRSWWRIGV